MVKAVIVAIAISLNATSISVGGSVDTLEPTYSIEASTKIDKLKLDYSQDGLNNFYIGSKYSLNGFNAKFNYMQIKALNFKGMKQSLGYTYKFIGSDIGYDYLTTDVFGSIYLFGYNKLNSGVIKYISQYTYKSILPQELLLIGSYEYKAGKDMSIVFKQSYWVNMALFQYYKSTVLYKKEF